jgi:glycogen operon protein
MKDEAWNAPHIRCLGVRLDGEIGEVDERGQAIVGDTLLLLLNAHHERVPFRLPAGLGPPWERILDTAQPSPDAEDHAPGNVYPLEGRSLALFRLLTRQQTAPPAEARST